LTNQKTPAPIPRPYEVKRKKRKRGSRKWIAALIVLLLAGGAFFVLQEYLIFTPEGIRLATREEADTDAAEEHADAPLPQIDPNAGPRVSIDMGELPPEGAGHLAGGILEVSGRSAEEILADAAALHSAGYTAAVVPVKPADGAAVSRSELESARAACDAAGLRLVAWISCFRDDVTAREQPALACCDAEGNLFIDHGYCTWLNPYEPAAREAVLERCRFAISCGADELILDHLSFPHSGNTDTIAWLETEETPRAVISAFAAELRSLSELRMGAVLYGDDTLGEGASEEKGQDAALFLSHFERIWVNATDETEAQALYRQCCGLSADAAHAFGAILADRLLTEGYLFP